MIVGITLDLRLSAAGPFFTASDATMYTTNADFTMRGTARVAVMKTVGYDFNRKIIGTLSASPLDSGIRDAFAPLWLRRLPS